MSLFTTKKRVADKLKSIAGDSLGEVLVAILVVAFGALLLATMSTTSTNIILKNQEEMNTLYAAEQVVATTVSDSDSIRISVFGTSVNASVDVDVYEDDEERFLRYEAR